MKKHLFISFAILLFGCTLDSPEKDKLPVWSTTIEIPIIQTRIDLDTFLEDSLISVNEDSIYVFNKTVEIDPVEVGDQLKIDPIEKSFVQYASAVTVDSSNTTFTIGYDSVGLDNISEPINAKIGLVELNNLDPDTTNPFIFRDIYPAIDDIPDGQLATIPPFEFNPVMNPFSFDDFGYAVFSGGQLQITIQNDMVIPLGSPINIQFQQVSGPDTTDIPGGMLQFNSVIDANGGIASETMYLAGMTLPGEILIMVTGSSQGTQGIQILIDEDAKNSSFQIIIDGFDLEVISASAVIPQQTIEENGSIALVSSETVVEEAIMSNGDLNIIVTNNLPLTGNVQLVIPSLYFGTADSTFTKNFGLATGTFSVPTANMSGWTMAMDYADQRLNYHYLITTNDTDPNNVPIDSSDNVELDLAISDIFFSEVTGQIESQTITEEGDISIVSESQIQSASISAGQMDMIINNSIGGAADVQLTVPELVRSGIGLDTVLIINPGENVHSISLSGYGLLPVSLVDQRLTYGTTTITQSGSNTFYLNDSINVAINLSGLTFDAVTGYISQGNIVDEDVIELDNDTKVETALIDSGQIQLTIQNFIGLEAGVVFTIEELSLEGSSLESSFGITSTTEPMLQTIDLSGYSLNLDMADQQVNYTSALTIDSKELLTLTLNDSIAIDVLIDTLWFSSVTGIIDTVEVTIDTVEQEISALPDDMDGFEFTNVEISIDFESDISIPVFLDLTMKASNSAGEMDSSSITNWNITDSSSVIIPKANQLINIQPDMILAYGSARVGGDGTSGTVTSDQTIAGLLSVKAPLELEIGPDAQITTDPELTTEADAGETIPEELEEIMVFIRYDNEFEFGTAVTVLMSQDTLHFDDGTADVLVDSLLIYAGETGLDSLVLNDERLGLFNQDSMYVQAKINVLGQTDENGNPVPSKFLSTDTLQLNIYGRIQYLIDGPELAGDDE